MITGLPEVAALLRSRRISIGVTQKLLAEITGVPAESIGRLERCRADVPFAHLTELAWWLDLHLSFTLTGRRR